ncbi:MAG TPA: SpoIIE family protein phosphatase [bacterium]|nr:SpoIIE family protein phosphatase [bacterium]
MDFRQSPILHPELMQAKPPRQTGAPAPHEDLPILLVVDDDPDILRVVRFYLTKQRYIVHTAASGREAMDVLDREPEVELILSDVMMPDMSGLDLLMAVREDDRFADIPVILISAEGETSKKVAGLNLGADDFITKPFNFDELMARVKNHIRLRRLQKEVLIASRQVLQANAALQRQNDRFQEDLEAARSLQMSLMPDALPDTPPLRLGARYLPAERLGGDLFDIVELDGGRRLGLLVADVCGHGITAAFITAMTKITFQSACQSSSDPAVVLDLMNRELAANLANGFVTVFYGVYDRHTRTLACASGGHPPVLVHRRPEGRILDLLPQATFLGCFQQVHFRTETLELKPGDRIILYTDGLFESRIGPDGEEFGMERVRAYLTEYQALEIQPLLDGLVDTLADFMNHIPVDDDITIVGMDVLG